MDKGKMRRWAHKKYDTLLRRQRTNAGGDDNGLNAAPNNSRTPLEQLFRVSDSQNAGGDNNNTATTTPAEENLLLSELSAVSDNSRRSSGKLS